MNVRREGLAFWRRALVWGCAACWGCATTVQFHGNTVETGQVRYRIGNPGQGFQKVEVGENDLAYWLPEDGATIGVHSTCRDFDDVPARALLNHLLFGTTDRQLVSSETMALDGRGALHAVYELALDGVPVRLEVIVLSKDGCVFDFSLVTKPERFDRSRLGFERLVQGFEMIARRS